MVSIAPIPPSRSGNNDKGENWSVFDGLDLGGDSDFDEDDEEWDEDKIPETLEEIYRISNRNRRRHKERKQERLQAIRKAEEAEEDYEETEEDRRVLDMYFGDAGKDLPVEEFLVQIGWCQGPPGKDYPRPDP